MSSTIEDIETYAFLDTDNLLLDANIWLRIHGPQADPRTRQTKVYSLALKNILTAKSQIHLDVTILSEVINRWARLKYQCIPQAQRPHNFKTYRQGGAFAPVAASIAKTAQDIVNSSQRISSDFENLDIGALLTEFSAGDSDFTDLILVNLCKQHGYKFITHDGDMKNSGINLLTANTNLLA